MHKENRFSRQTHQKAALAIFGGNESKTGLTTEEISQLADLGHEALGVRANAQDLGRG